MKLGRYMAFNILQLPPLKSEIFKKNCIFASLLSFAQTKAYLKLLEVIKEEQIFVHVLTIFKKTPQRKLFYAH